MKIEIELSELDILNLEREGDFARTILEKRVLRAYLEEKNKIKPGDWIESYAAGELFCRKVYSVDSQGMVRFNNGDIFRLADCKKVSPKLQKALEEEESENS